MPPENADFKNAYGWYVNSFKYSFDNYLKNAESTHFWNSFKKEEGKISDNDDAELEVAKLIVDVEK